MSQINSFTTVTDGDTIEQGWFNECISTVNQLQSIYGDGSDGAWLSTGSDTLAAGVHRFTSFNLQSGHTLTTTASNNILPLIILVTGDATITGTVNLSGKGLNGGTVGLSYATQYTVNGASETAPITIGTDATVVQASGFAGGKTYISNYLADTFYRISPINPLKMLNGTPGGALSISTTATGGSGGGASALNDGADGTSRGGTGGVGGIGVYSRADGGCSFILICKGNLTITGTINVSGSDGATPTDTNNSGNGGGGAGIIFLVYGGTLSDSGTYTITGGSGSSGNGDGGDGGDGGAGTAIRVASATLLGRTF